MENSRSSHLVLGVGQIGTALMKVLKPNYSVYGYDRKDQEDPLSSLAEGAVFDVLHVTFPYSDNFVSEVKRYQKIFGNAHTLVIIHSTVKEGTTEQIDNAVHSPVRGIHPDLEGGIRTFVKFFGGMRSEEAADYFRALGLVCKTTQGPRNTEAMKLWDTTIYGVNIALEKRIWDYCEAHKLDFDIVYTLSCQSYNIGYEKLGHPEYKKYILTHIPGKIGGHCVIQNLSLLDDKEITDFIL